MGAIEDVRKVMQDFLAPELRAISERLDALEKRMEARDRQVDKSFADAETMAKERYQALQLSITSLANYNELRDRMVRLESKELAHQ